MKLSTAIVVACLVVGPSVGHCQSGSGPANSLLQLLEGPYLSSASSSAPPPSTDTGTGNSPPAPLINSIGEATSATPNGNLSVFTDDPGFISNPGAGIAQAVLYLGPCAVDIPHHHPRAAETSFMLYGAIQFGVIQEDNRNNQLEFQNISTHQSIHIPAARLHFAYNPTCEPAAFLASFDDVDPGVQTTWASFAQIPTHIINGATGFSEQQITQLKGFPLVTQPATGGEECLKQCGLSFDTENKLAPLASITP